MLDAVFRALGQAFPSAGGRHCVSLQIRIISPPPGEAPANIRAAWVGCVLPLFATTDDPRVGGRQEGVLSRQPGTKRGTKRGRDS